jgi:uncharacterized membrane protein YjfL (UPF0719 family)
LKKSSATHLFSLKKMAFWGILTAIIGVVLFVAVLLNKSTREGFNDSQERYAKAGRDVLMRY